MASRTFPRIQLTDILLINAEMYRLADTFLIPALKTMASTKLLAAEHLFFKCEFDKVLDYIWDITADGDVELRLPVYDCCVKNHKLVELRPEIEAQIIELVSFSAWNVDGEIPL